MKRCSLASAECCIRSKVSHVSGLPVSLQGPHQRSLLKSLLKDYNRMERPVANDSQPLTVVFTLSLIQIMDVVSGVWTTAEPPASRRDVCLLDKVRLVVEQKGKKMTSGAVIKINFSTYFF